MKKIGLLLVVAVAVLFVVVGCGKSMKEYAGTYEGQYIKLVGSDEKETDGEFKLELKEDGTGVSYRNDAEYKITWKVDDSKFTMTEKFFGMTIDYTGTIKGKEISIYNGEESNPFTYQYVYEKK